MIWRDFFSNFYRFLDLPPALLSGGSWGQSLPALWARGSRVFFVTISVCSFSLCSFYFFLLIWQDFFFVKRKWHTQPTTPRQRLLLERRRRLLHHGAGGLRRRRSIGAHCQKKSQSSSVWSGCSFPWKLKSILVLLWQKSWVLHFNLPDPIKSTQNNKKKSVCTNTTVPS